MSYLLDALRKSESERAAQANQPVFSAHQTSIIKRPKWLVPVVVAVLLLNVMVLSYFFFAGDGGAGRATDASVSIDSRVPPVRADGTSQNKGDVVGASSRLAAMPGNGRGTGGAASSGAVPVEKNDPVISVRKTEKPSGKVAERTQVEAIDKVQAPISDDPVLAARSSSGRSIAAEIDQDRKSLETRQAGPQAGLQTELKKALAELKPAEQKTEVGAEPVAVVKPVSEKVPELREMPENFRRNLPSLFVNVYVYADNPADRFVVVNMSKYRIGDKFKEGILLEDIEPDFMKLQYNDQLFRLPRP